MAEGFNVTCSLQCLPLNKPGNYLSLLGWHFCCFSFTDHSFFGTEWQKRWCALSHQTFYYYGSERGASFLFCIFLHISSKSIMNHIVFEEIEVKGYLAFCFWQWHCSCCMWTINDGLLISCNQTSSRRGSSVSTATLSRWTAAYGETQRKTVALKFRLQTSESIRYAGFWWWFESLLF